MRTGVIAVALITTLLAAALAQAAVTISTVPVGNPGNAADTRYATPGYGAVSYSYSIGKYEVTQGQYCEFLNAVATTDTYGLYDTSMAGSGGCQITRHGSSGSYTYDFSGRPTGTTVNDWANRPVNYVAWGDAARFANWLHNGQPVGGQTSGTTEDGAYALNGITSDAALLAVVRKPNATWVIPSESEWYKAAYYNPATGSCFDFATSSNATPGRDMTDASGNNANYWTTGWLLGSPFYTTLVGQFPNSDSPYGTLDQAGNVWEWTEGIGGSRRIARGGADDVGDWALRASNRQTFDPSFSNYYSGFRVAYIPEPATISLLALGGLALLRRRK